MFRICVFAMFVTMLLASTNVAARDPGLGAAEGETCAEKQAADKNAAARASTTRSRVPARETQAKPGGRTEVPSGRLQSPRWHSFLPGMFR